MKLYCCWLLLGDFSCVQKVTGELCTDGRVGSHAVAILYWTRKRWKDEKQKKPWAHGKIRRRTALLLSWGKVNTQSKITKKKGRNIWENKTQWRTGSDLVDPANACVSMSTLFSNYKVFFVFPSTIMTFILNWTRSKGYYSVSFSILNKTIFHFLNTRRVGRTIFFCLILLYKSIVTVWSDCWPLLLPMGKKQIELTLGFDCLGFTTARTSGSYSLVSSLSNATLHKPWRMHLLASEIFTTIQTVWRGPATWRLYEHEWYLLPQEDINNRNYDRSL